MEDTNQVAEVLRFALAGVFIASRCLDEPVEKESWVSVNAKHTLHLKSHNDRVLINLRDGLDLIILHSSRADVENEAQRFACHWTRVRVVDMLNIPGAIHW